jgi:hypothetical protein
VGPDSRVHLASPSATRGVVSDSRRRSEPGIARRATTAAPMPDNSGWFFAESPAFRLILSWRPSFRRYRQNVDARDRSSGMTNSDGNRFATPQSSPRTAALSRRPRRHPWRRESCRNSTASG